MIKSMTGFGRCEAVTDECKISVEIKAVNHRYLDLSIKMPKKFNYFEAAMRTLLKDYIQRGKVDVFITYEDYTEDQVSLKYNSTLAAEYMKNFEKMAEQFGLEDDVTVSMLSRCPEVLTMEQVPEDEEHMWAMLQEVLKGAAEKLCGDKAQRGREPEERPDRKAGPYAVYGGLYRGAFPEDRWRNTGQRLEDKVRELLQDSTIDESRIAHRGDGLCR